LTLNPIAKEKENIGKTRKRQEIEIEERKED